MDYIAYYANRGENMFYNRPRRGLYCHTNYYVPPVKEVKCRCIEGDLRCIGDLEIAEIIRCNRHCVVSICDRGCPFAFATNYEHKCNDGCWTFQIYSKCCRRDFDHILRNNHKVVLTISHLHNCELRTVTVEGIATTCEAFCNCQYGCLIQIIVECIEGNALCIGRCN